eukprot:TRINITY_DN6222_c1_g2_i2.p1 TRINITY_DN6222_c1_g2~~TRINITY_DN6222_c1_g2_i2.p1  ORF type:complete len:415 (-),score=80.30 TRINITY_DN6222_c1_g2_i2:896-2140(-)
MGFRHTLLASVGRHDARAPGNGSDLIDTLVRATNSSGLRRLAASLPTAASAVWHRARPVATALTSQETIPASLPNEAPLLPSAKAQRWSAQNFLEKLGDITRLCDTGSAECTVENFHIIALVTTLVVGIFLVLCFYLHLRDDKEEQIKPLVPELIVRGSSPLRLKFALESAFAGDGEVAITDAFGHLLCKVVTDWPDTVNPGFSGVAATVRLKNAYDHTLVTVVLRSVHVQGQGICIFRAGCDIFGFAEPMCDGQQYRVRHRSGLKILGLFGDLASGDQEVEFCSPLANKVATIRREGNECVGEVAPNVDAGLVLSCFFATLTNRQLIDKAVATASPWDFQGDPMLGGATAVEDLSGARVGSAEEDVDIESSGAAVSDSVAAGAADTAACSVSAVAAGTGATAEASKIQEASEP